jgi:hypothetical protein
MSTLASESASGWQYDIGQVSYENQSGILTSRSPRPMVPEIVKEHMVAEDVSA